ncbi:Hydroxysteroid dehydrogenase-like protein 2 [Desmophyllum pertusum]|uniref:Hydroxysteroid dehydrogenase-like protein 2 n=1 Tax=Desmophyllum pertusum TaxID=174260 RepID=A0A9W9YIS4_9CNID|nr:Hydroxysteroid dehydrogenase-like protein 2 [Desmophyllum pertusum]
MKCGCSVKKDADNITAAQGLKNDAEHRVRKLAGKTIFITGASRGIGKAIALKAAKDGANIVIAAKTTEPHPKLPGTIYTAAKEVEEAGGKCLPCAVDIRDEGAVTKAVQEAVKTFGGIDILVNNASAISLTGTLETPMKKYDLMNNINTRGTFLCSQACLPHLKKAKNPHILNVTPPLNIRPAWFKEHVAYSLSKYGMSLCVLGMSQEFKEDGIAVNALWPKKAIATVAVMVTAGKDALAYCRTDRCFADAAYVVLTRDSRARTGEFLYDEDVLKEAGVTDFEPYSYIPAGGPLPDSFIEGYSPQKGTSTRRPQRAPLMGAPGKEWRKFLIRSRAFVTRSSFTP